MNLYRAKFYFSFLIIFVLMLFLFQSHALAAGRQHLHGHVPAAVAHSTVLENLPADQQLNLTIGLPLRNQSDLNQLVKDLYDSQSPNYHQYLSVDQFTEKYGPTRKDYEAVVNFANVNGLKVRKTHPNRMLLEVTGTVDAVQKIFHVNLKRYQRDDGKKFFAPDNEPSIDLDTPILHISGLDNTLEVRNHRYSSELSSKSAVQKSVSEFSKRGKAIPNSGTGLPINIFNNFSGSLGNTYAGRDIRNIYVPTVLSSNNGAGQTIALFEADNFYPSDLANYANFNFLNILGVSGYPTQNYAGSPVPTVSVDMLVGNAEQTPSSADGEVVLDIEMAWAMAPGAVILVYEGPNTQDGNLNTPFGFAFDPTALLNQIATEDQAKQISNSWTWSGYNDPDIAQVFLEFAAQGQSFFQASGDTGAYGSTVNPNIWEPISMSPLMTVCGGTTLITSGSGGMVIPGSPGVYQSESTWNDPNERLNQPTANPPSPNPSNGVYKNSVSSGGFCSNNITPDNSYGLLFPTWQSEINYANTEVSTTYRNIPDVAFLADDILITLNGSVELDAGTSAAAPLWAGFTALVNQQAQAANGGALGFANPALYNAAGYPGAYTSTYFHDINDNSNNIYTGYGNQTGYHAVTGYDLATGLGTPKQSLINFLAGSFATGQGMPTPVTGTTGSVINWSEATSNAGFGYRASFNSLVYDANDGQGPRMWIIGGTPPEQVGGENPAPPTYSDVWSSSNGSTWNQVQSSAAFGPLAFNGQASVVFDPLDGRGPRMWVIGGTGSTNSATSTYYSFNGNLWTQTSGATSPLPALSSYNCLVFKDPADSITKIWVIDGGAATNIPAVYCSKDGINWIKKSPSAGAGFPVRIDFSGMVFNPMDGRGPRMYVMAGFSQSPPLQALNDEYSSFDGITWTLVNQTSAFTPRIGAGSISAGGKMWLMGGEGATSVLNDVWESANGTAWYQVPTGTVFEPRWFFGTLFFNNAIWVMGGNYTEDSDYTDVWSYTNLPVITPLNSSTVITNVSAVNFTGTSTAVTIADTVSGTNTLLLAQINIEANGPTDTVNEVTYAGMPLTKAVAFQDKSSGHGSLETWYLVNPPSGTNNVIINISDTTAQVLHIGVTNYEGVNQSTPIGAVITINNQTASTSHGVTVATTAANSLIQSMVAFNGGGPIAVGSSQIQNWQETDNLTTEGDGEFASAIGNYPLSYTMSTNSSVDIEAVEIIALGSTPFTPTPSICSNAVSVTSSGTGAGGSTGTNFDTLTDALGSTQSGAITACAGGTVYVYKNISENPTISSGVNIQGEGSVTWTSSADPIVKPSSSLSGGVTVQGMAVSQMNNGDSVMDTASFMADNNQPVVFIQDTFWSYAGGNDYMFYLEKQGEGKVSFNRCLFDGANGNYGFYISNAGDGYCFVNCIFQRYSYAINVYASLLVSNLKIYNCTFGNMSQGALNSGTGSNGIDVENCAFVSNSYDNEGSNFTKSDFVYCAFGDDSVSGYPSSDEAINTSAFVSVSENNFQEVTTGTTTTVDKGTTLSGVTVDYLGVSRPQGSAYDIGAYEYVPVITNTPTYTNTLSSTPTITLTPTITPTPQSCNIQVMSSMDGSSSSLSPSFTVTVPANTNNSLVVIHVFCTSNATNVTGTIGGYTMTQVNRAGTGCGVYPGYECALYYPGLSAGTYTVNLTDDGGSGFSTYYEAIVYSNVNQTTPVGISAYYISCQSTSSPSYSFGTTDAANSLISAMLITSGNPSITPGSNQHQVISQVGGSTITQEVDDQQTTATGTYTMSYTVSPSQYYLYEAFEIEQASCGAQPNVVRGSVLFGELQTQTPTNTPSPTCTSTPTATPTVSSTPTSSALLQSAVAGPNISRNGEPIKFMVNLGGNATIKLNLFNLMGEQIFSETIQGNAGLNTITWLLRNNAQSPVASGLYVYAIQVNNGSETVTKTGKVVVFH